MNRLPVQKRALILQLLCEGASIRATSRIAKVAVNTVIKLLKDAGSACLDYQDKTLTGLSCGHIQCDEIWSFVHCKEKNIPKEQEKHPGKGNMWTWVAMDADTKLIPYWLVGKRSVENAMLFMKGIASKVNGCFQLTTDGYRPYAAAVENAFGGEVDYAMLVKLFDKSSVRFPERKYSPGAMEPILKTKMQGSPDMAKASTAYVERQNLTMRMHMRRFTRLTNAFSKKAENHIHAVSLFYMYYNFIRPHKTLGKKRTPAMAAGICDHRWSFEDVVNLVG